jgi:LPXTG-motif cell wall-anchored protein
MDYLIVPTSGLSPAKATALAAFIRFVLGSGGQALVESYGAAPVTPSMVAVGLRVAGEVAAQGTPPVGTPEAPMTIALPIIAAVLLGGGGLLVIRRRRSPLATP